MFASVKRPSEKTSRPIRATTVILPVYIQVSRMALKPTVNHIFRHSSSRRRQELILRGTGSPCGTGHKVAEVHQLRYFTFPHHLLHVAKPSSAATAVQITFGPRIEVLKDHLATDNSTNSHGLFCSNPVLLRKPNDKK
jgi:hypothetical protein